MRGMRRVPLFAVSLVFLCLAHPGLAQEKADGGIYAVKEGDTLWDISSKVLKDPFLWPKLWQRNPYITNPHWIYPGNPIRLSPLAPEGAKKEEPGRVAAEERSKEGLSSAPGLEPEGKREEPVPVVLPAAPPVEEKPEVVAEVKKRADEKPYFPENRFSGFFSNVAYRGMGMILESKEGKSLMAEGDVVYLVFKTSEPILIGSKYTIVRPSETIRHPMTGEKMGNRYNVTGNVQIIDRFGRYFTARVIEAFQEIQKGDILQPYQKERMERPK